MNKPTLNTGRLKLRPLKVSDAEKLTSLYRNEEVNRLTGTRRNFTVEEIQEHLERIQEDDSRYDFAITLKENAELIGEIVLNDIDAENRSCNFRIAVFDPANFNKGYGSEATAEVMAFAFKELKLHRISLEVFEFNFRAIRSYEKSGFVKEGILRDGLYWDGTFYDVVSMGLIAPDWQRLFARLN